MWGPQSPLQGSEEDPSAHLWLEGSTSARDAGPRDGSFYAQEAVAVAE